MAALDASIGGTSANSYSSQADATDYLTTERLYTAAWVAASTADKDAALIWATRTLDSLFDWLGDKVVDTQALRHPRYGLLDPDGYSILDTVLAPNLVRATQSLAANLLEQDRLSDPELTGLGLSRLKIDTIEMTIDGKNLQEIVPQDIILMLDHLGDYTGAAGRNSRSLKVRRT
jgi:hypothetical protein